MTLYLLRSKPLPPKEAFSYIKTQTINCKCHQYRGSQPLLIRLIGIDRRLAHSMYLTQLSAIINSRVSLTLKTFTRSLKKSRHMNLIQHKTSLMKTIFKAARPLIKLINFHPVRITHRSRLYTKFPNLWKGKLR